MFFKYILFTAVFFVIGCEEPLIGQLSTSDELVGTWVSSDVNANSKACEGLDVDKDGVTMDMIKIKKDGSLYGSRKVKSTQNLFKKEGSVDQLGQVNLDKKSYKEYFGDAAEKSESQGFIFTPNVRISTVVLSSQSTLMEMKIDATLSRGPAIYKQTFPSKYYQFANDAKEAQLISKLTQCLDD